MIELTYPAAAEVWVAAAFAYSEPGAPPARICSSIIRAAWAEMLATQASEPEAEGSDNEPRVADADESHETEVCIGRVRNFEFYDNKQRKKKARMRMLGKPPLESRPRSSVCIRRAAAGWLSSLPIYSTKVSPKRVPAGGLVTRSYLFEWRRPSPSVRRLDFLPAQHQRMYDNHVS